MDFLAGALGFALDPVAALMMALIAGFSPRLWIVLIGAAVPTAIANLFSGWAEGDLLAAHFCGAAAAGTLLWVVFRAMGRGRRERTIANSPGTPPHTRP